MKIAILADIHGNRQAMETAVTQYLQQLTGETK
jgi:hypothetical protein